MKRGLKVEYEVFAPGTPFYHNSMKRGLKAYTPQHQLSNFPRKLNEKRIESNKGRSTQEGWKTRFVAQWKEDWKSNQKYKLYSLNYN